MENGSGEVGTYGPTHQEPVHERGSPHVQASLETRVFWLKARFQLERKHYECIRVNGDIICKWCKKPYYKHRAPFEWCPTMVIDCEGRQLKL